MTGEPLTSSSPLHVDVELMTTFIIINVNNYYYTCRHGAKVFIAVNRPKFRAIAKWVFQNFAAKFDFSRTFRGKMFLFRSDFAKQLHNLSRGQSPRTKKVSQDS